MIKRILGLECEYGLTFSPTGRVYLPIEKILGYIFEGLIPNSWPSNAFLTNGARFYQDTGCHPEYSTPECDDLIDLVIHDKAGERILESCLPIAEERLREEGLSGDIFIFKNNTDSLGNTYGSHENFLMRRDVDFWKVSEQLIPFFVTRQIYSGAGKILKVSGKSQFFISQRAQHIHEKTSSSTTSSRSIINTRDEPHSDAEKFRRLHIILGDSNMSEFATYLKVGTAMIVLSMIEDGYSIPNIDLWKFNRYFGNALESIYSLNLPTKYFPKFMMNGAEFCKSLLTLPCNWSEKSTGLQKNGYWKIIWLKSPADGTTQD
jgi:proteasome accessory factor A